MGTIKISYVYQKSKDVVWAHLTHEDLLNKWCVPTSGFSLQIGKIFRFESNPSTYWKGIFINTILDYKVCKSLSYRFECEKKKLDTTVTFQLEEANGKTKLLLEHSGFKFKDFFTKLHIKHGWEEMIYDNLDRKLKYKNE
jgi:uncharacterized protein YndB with AHSA1/START domain